MNDLKQKIEELEKRIEALEHEPMESDLIACSFEEVMLEPRWKNIQK